jgi:hypothetical protein
MNWFSLFAMLLLVTQASVPSSGKAVNNSTHNSRPQNEGTDGGKNPATELVSLHTKEGYGATLKADAEKYPADNNQSSINVTNPAPVPVAWGKREWAIWGANLALAVVGIGGIVVAIYTLCFIKKQAVEMRRQRITMEKTLNAIRRQGNLMEQQTGILEKSVTVSQKSADAAEKSAEVALKSVEIDVNSERAWVIDEIRQPGMLPTNSDHVLKAYITFKNWGRVPALVTDLKIRFHTFGKDENGMPDGEFLLPEVPTYDTEQIFLELGDNGIILAPEQSIIIPCDFEENGGKLPRWLWLLLEAKSVRLVCYGMITYRDGFNVERFTQFCHMWDRGYDPFGVIPSFRRLGPNYYNKAT